MELPLPKEWASWEGKLEEEEVGAWPAPLLAGPGFPFLVIEVIMIPLTAGVLDLVERWLKGEQMFSSLQVPFCVCRFCPRG